jgi:integrase
MTVGALGAAWRSACKEAGVVAQFRDIRAKAATDAKKGGQDYQKLLGHANPAMSERYIKRREAVIAEPVRRKL